MYNIKWMHTFNNRTLNYLDFFGYNRIFMKKQEQSVD